MAQAARRESEAAEPDEGRVPRDDLARAADAAQRGARLGAPAAHRQARFAPTAARGLESIERNVRLQAQLTGDLLDVSKALTGQLQLDSRPGLARRRASGRRSSRSIPAAQAKGVQVTVCDPRRRPSSVLGDATRLRQIAWHLLANAIKFTPRGGTVDLTRRDSRSDSAILTVVDSGPGIDPEFLPRIFDRFTQEDPSPTRTAGGLGVGLSLVRELVELHGGEIRGAQRRGRQRGGVHGALSASAGGAGASRPRSPADVAAVVAAARRPACAGPRSGCRRPRAAAHGAAAARRGWCGPRTRSPMRSRRSRHGGPTCWSATARTPEHDSYALVGKVQSLEAERGRPHSRRRADGVRAHRRARAAACCEAFQRDLPKPVEPARAHGGNRAADRPRAAARRAHAVDGGRCRHRPRTAPVGRRRDAAGRRRPRARVGAAHAVAWRS